MLTNVGCLRRRWQRPWPGLLACILLVCVLTGCAGQTNGETASSVPLAADFETLPLGEPAEEVITAMGLEYQGDSGSSHYSRWSDEMSPEERLVVDGVAVDRVSYQVEDGVVAYISYTLMSSQFDTEEAFLAAVADWHAALESALTKQGFAMESTLTELLESGELEEGRRVTLWTRDRQQAGMYLTAQPSADGALKTSCEVLYRLLTDEQMQ